MITVFSKESLPMERGVGHIYSQSRGRGHRKFFWSEKIFPRPPQIYYLKLEIMKFSVKLKIR